MTRESSISDPFYYNCILLFTVTVIYIMMKHFGLPCVIFFHRGVGGGGQAKINKINHRCSEEERRGEYWGLEVFLLQYLPLVKI